jgi:hypothetical protein
MITRRCSERRYFLRGHHLRGGVSETEAAQVRRVSTRTLRAGFDLSARVGDHEYRVFAVSRIPIYLTAVDVLVALLEHWGNARISLNHQRIARVAVQTGRIAVARLGDIEGLLTHVGIREEPVALGQAIRATHTTAASILITDCLAPRFDFTGERDHAVLACAGTAGGSQATASASPALSCGAASTDYRSAANADARSAANPTATRDARSTTKATYLRVRTTRTAPRRLFRRSTIEAA